MSGDEAGFFWLCAENVASFCGDKTVACTVGTVAADRILFVELVRNAVEESLFRHCLVECGVKDGDLRKAREELGCAFHTGCVSRFVERCKQGDATDVVDDFLSHLFALDVLSAMHHAVTDGFDGRGELLRIEELFDLVHGFGVGRAIEVEVDFAFRSLSLGVTVHADIFDETACDRFFRIGIDNGKLHRGTAAVQNEYAHNFCLIFK